MLEVVEDLHQLVFKQDLVEQVEEVQHQELQGQLIQEAEAEEDLQVDQEDQVLLL
jgi:hypothetical protein